MITKPQSRWLGAVGALALALAVSNGALLALDREGQATLLRQQQFIQQTAPLDALYRDIVKTLAETAIRGNDKQVLDMLAAHGLNVTVNNNDPAAAKMEK